MCSVSFKRTRLQTRRLRYVETRYALCFVCFFLTSSFFTNIRSHSMFREERQRTMGTIDVHLHAALFRERCDCCQIYLHCWSIVQSKHLRLRRRFVFVRYRFSYIYFNELIGCSEFTADVALKVCAQKGSVFDGKW